MSLELDGLLGRLHVEALLRTHHEPQRQFVMNHRLPYIEKNRARKQTRTGYSAASRPSHCRACSMVLTTANLGSSTSAWYIRAMPKANVLGATIALREFPEKGSS